MTNDYFISIYLDTRRIKKNDKYPVKLRVFTPNPREQKLYPTKFEFTEDEFQSIWQLKKPRNEHKKTRSLLRAIEENAEKIAGELKLFSFDEFEKLLFSDQITKDKDISFYYEQAIEDYKRNRRIGTASNYEYSLKSLVEFQGKDKLKFNRINIQWLRDFENHLVEEKKLSKTTVGMYLRPLRAIFNTAKIKDDQYPFGKNKYSIPNPKDTVIISKFSKHLFYKFSFLSLLSRKKASVDSLNRSLSSGGEFILRFFLLLHKRAERRLSLHHYPKFIKPGPTYNQG